MEKNQKNAAEVKTSVPDLIPSNYCKKAEALGWVIDEDKVCGVFTFRQGSPAGEDYSFDLYADDDFSDGVAAAVRRVYDDFDIDEHVGLFAEASMRGESGVPKLSILVDDAKEIDEMLRTLADAFEYIEYGAQTVEKPKTRCCPVCGGTEFSAHQVVHIDVLIDIETGFFDGNIGGDIGANICEVDDPYGPYTCMNCRFECDELSELEGSKQYDSNVRASV